MHAMPARFNPVSEDYARFRPRYPSALMLRLMEGLADTNQLAGLWIDIGSGTGIFTRQLAEILPAGTSVIGLEPSAAMREKAERR